MIQRASSEARKATAAATSSGVGIPGIGAWLSRSRRMASGSGARAMCPATSSVMTAIGATASPVEDAVLTIAPPRPSSIALIPRRRTWNAPSALTPITCRHAASVVSCSGI